MTETSPEVAQSGCESCTRFAGSLVISCTACGKQHPFIYANTALSPNPWTGLPPAQTEDADSMRPGLLADAAAKPVRLFRQWDVFPWVGFDLNPPINEQGDQHWGGHVVHELRRGTPVRV
jgi:hypothetical protein